MKKFKKIVAVVLCLIMAMSSLSLAFGEAKDYEGHWAQATIQKWIDEGKISGYPDGSFKPDANVTRAEFVKMVNSIIDYDVKGSITFDDVKSSDWYYDFIRIAQEIGYISGYSKTQFGPTDNITREQAASILARVQYLGESIEASQKFIDKSSISSWAAGSVGAASSAGFINGYSDNSFKPLNKLTRAEAVTMLDNLLENAKNTVVYKAGTELKDWVVEGDLIVAKTVGEGDVHLTNVTVAGDIYVYGGGLNSVYFNNVKAAKIIVEKDKVRLVFDGGSKVEELALGSETIVVNENGQIGKITITSDGKVTLSGSFDSVVVQGTGNLVLDDAKIKNLVVEEKITISGKGTIETLTANADGIQYESAVKINKVEIGSGVTEKPAVITESGGGGGGGTGGNGGSTTSYAINVKATVDNESFDITTNAFTGTEKLSDFLVGEVNLVLTAGTKNEKIEEYFGKLVPKLDKVKIGSKKLYAEEGFNEILSYFKNTSIQSKLQTQKAGLLDGTISIAEIKAVISVYDSKTLDTDLAAIKENLKDYPFDKQTISYNGVAVAKPYTITYKTTTVTQNSEVAEIILEKLAFSTMTVNDFFNEFGDELTITSTVDSKTSTIVIEKVELK